MEAVARVATSAWIICALGVILLSVHSQMLCFVSSTFSSMRSRIPGLSLVVLRNAPFLIGINALFVDWGVNVSISKRAITLSCRLYFSGQL